VTGTGVDVWWDGNKCVIGWPWT